MDATIHKIEEYLGQGRYLEAHSMIKSIMDYDPESLRFKQIYGLSLSKSGAYKPAQEYLEVLHSENPEDEETSGILGGVYKELFKITENPKYATLSRDVYLQNYLDTKSYYTGINASAMSVIGGAARKGREIAADLVKQLDPSSSDFWEIATLGEAYLLTRDYENSYKFYNKARDLANKQWGWILSVYNQINLLNHFIRIPQNIRSLFETPGIVAFVGHMVDHPDRANKRFPPEIEDEIKRAIRVEIEALNARIGYCSLACGSDILFAEAMIEMGGELHIFLPFKVEDFLNLSVRFASSNWETRFNKIFNDNSVKFITREGYNENDMLFNILGRVIFGSTFIKGKILRTKPHLLTVLSESDLSKKTGGSRDLMELWPYKENWENINPDKYRNDSNTPLVKSEEAVNTEAKQATKSEGRGNIYCIIYIRLELTKGEDPEVIWEAVKDQINEWFLKPLVFDSHQKNLICIYRSTQSAAEFAFFMKEFIYKTFHVNCISGLHMGPIEIGNSERVSLSEPHVFKLNDIIEPGIEGSIYCSDVYSSVLALESNEYNFSPVGTVLTNEGLEPEEVFVVTRKIDDSNL